MTSKTLLEKIEALPPEKRAEVEEFVDFVATRPQRGSGQPLSELLSRVDEHRERLRREVGLFDSVAAIGELRDE